MTDKVKMNAAKWLLWHSSLLFFFFFFCIFYYFVFLSLLWYFLWVTKHLKPLTVIKIKQWEIWFAKQYAMTLFGMTQCKAISIISSMHFQTLWQNQTFKYPLFILWYTAKHMLFPEKAEILLNSLWVWLGNMRSSGLSIHRW